MSRVLIYQANGVQGAATLHRVHQAGYTTRALIRNPSTSDRIASQGIEFAIADLTDREALLRAHESVDHVVLQIPAHGDEFVRLAADNALYAMRSAAVKGAILKMANPTPSLHLPNSGFSSNAIIQECFRSCDIPCAVLEPTMYLDTFLKPNLRQEIAQESVIDLPLSRDLKIAWTTVDDAARMAADLLKSSGHGISVRCAGAAVYTGDELAAVFSNVLGRRIKYRNTEIGEFQRDIESAIGARAAAPAVSKFRFLAQFPEEANRMLRGSLLPAEILPNFRPTSAEEWITANRAQFAA